MVSGDDVSSNPELFKFVSNGIAEQFWIVFGELKNKFTKWPILEVTQTFALLHCAYEKFPKFPSEMCRQEPGRNQETLKISTFVLKPDIYVQRGKFKGKSSFHFSSYFSSKL